MLPPPAEFNPHKNKQILFWEARLSFSVMSVDYNDAVSCHQSRLVLIWPGLKDFLFICHCWWGWYSWSSMHTTSINIRIFVFFLVFLLQEGNRIHFRNDLTFICTAQSNDFNVKTQREELCLTFTNDILYSHHICLFTDTLFACVNTSPTNWSLHWNVYFPKRRAGRILSIVLH